MNAIKSTRFSSVLKVILLILLTNRGFATNYTVNSLANTNTGAANSGTLFYCITQANLSVGPHLISFSVAGTININTDPVGLPTLTRAIVIDATTAPGYAGSPVVILNGTGSTNINGMTITSANCEIYGLEIRNFPYRGVHFNGDVADNFRFGGSGKGNIIRANGYYGLQITGADNGYIEENKIGVLSTGATCSANGYDGIDLIGGANGNQILNNHIACNGYNALQIGASNNNIVRGNTIGPLTGTCSSNGYRGIDIESASTGNIIGGIAAGQANKIAGNLYWGIEVKDAGSINNIISGNSISCNDYGGIEVNTGGNNNIAAPVISAANGVSVSGTSLANATIEVFRAQDPALIICPMAPTPNNQGIDYLGTTTANGAGNWTLAGTFNGSLVATQRDATGNTSRFSAAVSTGVAPSFVNNCPGVIAAVLATSNNNLTVSCNGDGNPIISCSFENGKDIREVVVERTLDGVEYSFTGSTLNPSSGIFLLGDSWTGSEPVYYRLSLSYSNGEKYTSNLVFFDKQNCMNKLNSVEVFPNPSYDFVNLNFILEEEEFATIRFYDATGKIILEWSDSFHAGYNEPRFDLGSLAEGIYFVSFSGAKRSWSTKIVKR